MANNFVLNLRAVRSDTNSKASNMANNTKMPITRGDIQKQRQAQSKVDPNAFINFLRMITLSPEVKKEKEQLNIEDVPPTSVDKMPPERAEEHAENYIINRDRADRGTQYLENDLNKYNAAVNSDRYLVHGKSDFENAYGVLENYDALNDILDQYDRLNTWVEKRKFLKDAYRDFDDKYGDIAKWFDRLYGYTLEAQQYGEWDTKNVTDVMRQINSNVRKRLLQKS